MEPGCLCIFSLSLKNRPIPTLTDGSQTLVGAVCASRAGAGLGVRAVPRTCVARRAGLRAGDSSGAGLGQVGSRVVAEEPRGTGLAFLLPRRILVPAWDGWGNQHTDNNNGQNPTRGKGEGFWKTQLPLMANLVCTKLARFALLHLPPSAGVQVGSRRAGCGHAGGQGTIGAHRAQASGLPRVGVALCDPYRQ